MLQNEKFIRTLSVLSLPLVDEARRNDGWLRVYRICCNGQPTRGGPTFRWFGSA